MEDDNGIQHKTDQLCKSLATALGESDINSIHHLLEEMLTYSVLLTKDQSQRVPSTALHDLIAMDWSVLAAFDNVYEPTRLVPLCSSVFEMLLNHLHPDKVFAKAELLLALQHNSVCVKKVALNQLLRAPMYILDKDNAFYGSEIMNAIAHEDVGVGTAACDIFSALATTGAGLQFLLNPDFVLEMHAKAQGNPTCLIRIMCEVYVHVVERNPSVLSKVIACGAFRPLVDILNGDDVLAKMAMLESMSDLASSAAGHMVLSELGLVQQLRDVLLDQQHTDFDMLAPTIVHVFGLLSRHADNSSERIEEKTMLLGFALTQLSESTGGSPLDAACFDVIKFVGQSEGGVELLNTLTINKVTALKLVGENVSDSNKQAMQVAALVVLASIISPEKEVGKSVLEAISGRKGVTKFLEFIMGRTKLPFPEVSESAFDVIEALATSAWGREELLKIANFFQDITNRSVSSHPQRIRKHRIGSLFLNHPQGLSDNQITQLKLDIAAGAHGIRSGIGDSVMSDFL